MCVILLSLMMAGVPIHRDAFRQGFNSQGSVHFGEPISICNLIEVEKQVGSKGGGRVGSGPLTRTTLDFKIDVSICKIYPSPFKDYIYFNAPDIPPAGKPGEPQLPLKSFVVKLPLGSEVMSVEVIAGTYVKINNYLKIVPNPAPLIWHKQQKGGEYTPSPQIYNLEHYFPGKLVSFETGSDNHFTYCFVRLSPLQYIPAKGEAVLITSAKIEVYYQENTQGGSTTFEKYTSRGVGFLRARAGGVSLPLMGNEKSIIICPQEFQAQAESLKAFHEVALGLPTFIATTQWISANYDTAEMPPCSGWSYVDTSNVPIQGYNFNLAREIINYLRDNTSHPNLEHIVILGDAQKVPPSYYYLTSQNWYDGSDFAPSDFLYSSPDYDYVPNYGVGRLSVSNTTEIAQIIQKIKDWYPADWSWFKNTTIAGGDPFPGFFSYYGEGIVCDFINHEYFSGGNNLKCFMSDEKFTRGVLAPQLSDGNLGIFFNIGHGSGAAIRFDDGTNISANDLLGYPPADNLPIVVTIACIVGAFDADLANLGFPVSFGEAVLLSQAGGICFFGGSRSNAGGFDYYVDEGRLVVTRHTYFSEILLNVTSSYHSLKDTLGAIYKNTLLEFVSSNDMVGNTLNQWSLFCFTLLGDPALRIPLQMPGPDYQTPQLSAVSPTYYDTRSYPAHHLSGGLEITINSTTNSPTVKYKLCNAIQAGTAIDTTTDNAQPFDYTFSADSGMHLYLARTESEDKKEGWLYTYTTTGKIVVDGDPRDWDSAGIPPCATDPNDFTPEDYELTTLYVTDDKYNWYFGFDAFAGSTGVYYTIAIDCTTGGYTGTQGVDQDAFYNWVTFGNNHPVDYEIGIFPSPAVVDLWLGIWIGNTWSYENLADYGAYAALDTTSHFIEFMFPRSFLESSVAHLSLYSTGYDWSAQEYSPALDAVPMDTATYTTPVFGNVYANTITSFVTIYGVEEGQPKRAPILSLNVFPNPAHGNAVIHFETPQLSNPVTLKVYDLCGRLAKSLANGTGKSGKYSIKWNTSNVPSGVYFIRLSAGDYKLTKKLIITK